MSLNTSHLPLKHYRRWLDKPSAKNLFDFLTKNINWQIEHLEMFGKLVQVPRRIAFFGEEGLSYTYSKQIHRALPWPPNLVDLKEKIEEKLKTAFNSVLCNYYKDGNDYIGWHQDNEADLGMDPIIASISLGAERKFLLRNCQTRRIKEFILSDGDLFVMHSDCQRNWQHSLPRSRHIQNPRINLTYRKIIF